MPTDMTGENPLWKSNKPHFWDHYCLWDVFRSVMPLYTLIVPEQQERIVQSLLDIYDHRGWLPDAWLAGGYGCMQGGSNADVVLADAVVKGLKGFDIGKVYEAIKKDAEVASDNPGLYGRYLNDYLKYGYCTKSVGSGSCSRTLEYAYNDFCISQVAKKLGKDDDYQKYIKRSLNSFLLFNDSLKAVWGKDETGKWETAYTPVQTRKDPWNDPYFYEMGSSIYSGYYPHDMKGLINRLGGNGNLTSFLDNIFNKGYYDLNNEPGFLVPYLYNYCGRPDKTALRVRETLNFFKVGNKGFPGQDDSGALSSWFVFGAMGFFPVAGQDVYLIGSPVFEKTTIDLGKGRKFVIKAKNVSSENIYVQSVTLNGKVWTKNWFKHSDIISGAELILDMGKEPSEWGKTDLPPSITK